MPGRHISGAGFVQEGHHVQKMLRSEVSTLNEEEQKEVAFSKSPKNSKTPKRSQHPPERIPLHTKNTSLAGTTMQSVE